MAIWSWTQEREVEVEDPFFGGKDGVVYKAAVRDDRRTRHWLVEPALRAELKRITLGYAAYERSGAYKRRLDETVYETHWEAMDACAVAHGWSIGFVAHGVYEGHEERRKRREAALA